MSQATLASTIRLEGALFSRDFLIRLGAPLPDLSHLTPQSYGLAPEAKLREAISSSWNTLSARWNRFKTELGNLPPGDHAVALTRREWLLPVLQELGFGRVQTATAIRLTVGDETKEYAISHGWNRTPLHLLGAGVPLDVRTPGVPGAAQMAPHALGQECLNRSGDHLWAVLSNGTKWRLLRDSAAIARRSYVEFDLEAIFESENTADFALFWLLCHASRFEWRAEESGVEDSAEVAGSAQPPILEQWLQSAHTEGTKALDRMRFGVQEAIETLATGFVRHGGNGALREQLRSCALMPLDFYKLSLRVVYRILFLLVAEAKDALLLEDAPAEARRRYAEHYSLARLRTRAAKTRGTTHGDAWQGLRLTFGFFRDGQPGLAIPALGGFLFEETILDQSELANEDLLAAIRALCFFQQGGARRQVNFNLGSEELGSVYESLLELSPQLDLDARRFALETLAGNERKTTGSHYTPEILVKSLLDTALEPVLDRAVQGGETAILGLRICDWSSGSGHFLTAAARRIAERLALLRTGGDEPSPPQRRKALREVVGQCIYGVDLNPMAVELCKIALWMEGLEPGRPLSFLDSHIRCGNSLLGATPELIEGGLPDEAFAPLEGDDKKVCAALKKQNRAEGAGQGTLDFGDGWRLDLGDLRGSIARLEAVNDNKIEGVREKERMLAALSSADAYRFTHLLADAWCAAFVWKKRPLQEDGAITPITNGTLDTIRRNARAGYAQEQEIARLRAAFKWFHPHLQFADVFESKGGFDVNLGNPPWERVKLQEKEWFASRSPEIANAPNAAARGRLIEELKSGDPALHAAFLDDKRRAEGESHFARSSGRYPLCGRGDVNTYALFAELNRDLINDNGRAGIIVPSGIATDDTTKFFFQSLSENDSLVSLFDFENREAIFPGVHRSFKFCLLTMSGRESRAGKASFVFFATRAEHLDDPARRFALSGEDITLLNPNTKTCPIFRSSRDAELTKRIYRRVPVLVNEAQGAAGNQFNVEIGRMFHTSDDSPLFCDEETETTIRLYEAKCYAQFDHRYATWDNDDYREVEDKEKQNSAFQIKFRYNIESTKIPSKFQRRMRPWYLSFRKIARATDIRTLILSITPESGLLDSGNNIYIESAYDAAMLLACLNSFAADFVSRQKIGGANMTVGVMSQLPVLPPSTYDQTPSWTDGKLLRDWISRRVLELTYTAYDLRDWAHDLGYLGEPFGWDVARRFRLRCELDAAFFHLYGLTREEAAYVMDTFPIVRRKDEKEFGSYRTKDEILRVYDGMAGANPTKLGA